jgi:hypothetical protein
VKAVYVTPLNEAIKTPGFAGEPSSIAGNYLKNNCSWYYHIKLVA